MLRKIITVLSVTRSEKVCPITYITVCEVMTPARPYISIISRIRTAPPGQNFIKDCQCSSNIHVSERSYQLLSNG